MRALRPPGRRCALSLLLPSPLRPEAWFHYSSLANTQQITIATSAKKYDPTYNLTVKTPSKTLTFSRPFASWFDEQGRFVALPFQQMLASSVPLVGAADPQRVASLEDKEGGAGEGAGAGGVEGSGALEGASPEVLDAILEASRGVASGAEGKKGGRRRKA